MFGIKKKGGKKGELTSTQIVTIVLVIGGLIIGVLFLALFFEDRPDREVCRLSIIERASAPIAKGEIPLKCTTEKICIVSEKKNDCKEFAGEDNVRKVVLDIPTGATTNDDIKRDAAAKKIAEETANAMFDCWKMTGEGKLDIFEGGPLVSEIPNPFDDKIQFERIKPKCIVCSRVVLGEDVFAKEKGVKENGKDNKFLEKIDVNKYIANELVPGNSITYLQAFTGDDVSGGYAEFSFDETKNVDEAGVKPTYAPQIAMIFMQIKVKGEDPNDQGWKAFKFAGIVGLGTMFSAGKLIPVHPILKLATVGLAAGVFALDIASTASQNQLVTAASCGKFVTKKDGQYGCSLTRAVKWDVNLINEMCSGGIESNF